MNKKILYVLPILMLMMTIAIMPVSAKVTKQDLYTYPGGAEVAGKVMFGNPASKSENSAVDWTVTVILQNGAPNKVYLVYVEKNYGPPIGGGYISIGLLTTDEYGKGSFHYNGEFGTPVSTYLGIAEGSSVYLSICLNQLTGEPPADPVGIKTNLGASKFLSATELSSWTGTEITFR